MIKLPVPNFRECGINHYTEAQMRQSICDALEEAAKVCDVVPEFFRGAKDMHPLHKRECETAQALAIGIRKLKEDV